LQKHSSVESFTGHDFSACDKIISDRLCKQGMALAVPIKPHFGEALYQGMALAVPLKPPKKAWALAPARPLVHHQQSRSSLMPVPSPHPLAYERASIRVLRKRQSSDSSAVPE
jgi:hypothetical protein